MNKITKKLGQILFLKLISILKENDNYSSKIFHVRRLLEELFKELTVKENIEGQKTLFHLQQFFFYKYQYEGNIESKSHQLRKLCNKCIHGEKEAVTKEYITYTPTLKDYIYAVTSFSKLIYYFSEYKEPVEIQKHINSEKNKPKKNIRELKEEDLFNNPDPRIPVVLVLDTSKSMMIKDQNQKSRISLLNDGVRQFYNDIITNERTKDSVEICMVTFDEKVTQVADFNKAEKQTISNLIANGNGTLMNQGVKMALKLLEDRKKEYQNMGVAYYQPWLVLMTDGFPTENISESSNQTSKLAKLNKLTIFPVGISQGADLKILNKFSPLRPALNLKEYQFSEFFEWLHKSAVTLSESAPDAADFKIPKPTYNFEL